MLIGYNWRDSVILRVYSKSEGKKKNYDRKILDYAGVMIQQCVKIE